MTKRTIGIILIIVGVIGAAVSLAADPLGIGTYPGINWAQLLGAVVGIVVVMVGAWLTRVDAGAKV